MIDWIIEWIVGHIVGIYNWFISVLSDNAGTIGIVILGGIAIFLAWSIIDDL